MDKSSILLGILIVTVVIFIKCNYDNKNKLKKSQNNFVTGMWSNDKEEMYLYIDKKQNNNIHNGYVVRSNFANEPIKVKIDNNGDSKVQLQFKGTDCVKKVNNIKINMNDGLMTIQDRDDKELVLKKE